MSHVRTLLGVAESAPEIGGVDCTFVGMMKVCLFVHCSTGIFPETGSKKKEKCKQVVLSRYVTEFLQ